MFAFDLIALRGQDLRRYPLTVRKAMLRDVLKDSTRIRYVQHIGENGVRVFQAAAVIAKRADSPYGRGRTSDWVKIRTPHRDGPSGRAGEVETVIWQFRPACRTRSR